jgi:hypothetical protein
MYLYRTAVQTYNKMFVSFPYIIIFFRKILLSLTVYLIFFFTKIMLLMVKLYTNYDFHELFFEHTIQI